jgi:hypothetical protein
MSCVIVVRNLRGSWARRLSMEIAMREVNKSRVFFFDAQNYEFFPPNLKLGVFPSAASREKFFSRLKYKNSGFKAGSDQIVANGGVVKQLRGLYIRAKVFRFAFRVLILTCREDIKNLEIDKKNVGQALDGVFVGISGSTLYQPSDISFAQRFRATVIFVGSYYKFNSLFRKYKIDHLYLVNGRDALGTGCLASCILNKVEFSTLERGHLQNLESIPTMGIWKGNMHKWRNRKSLLALKLKGHDSQEAKIIAEATFDNSFGFSSKWWDGKDKTVVVPGDNIPNQPFICFFATSEIEFSGIEDEDGIVEENEQITQFILLKNIAKELGLNLLLRLHPNSGSKGYRFETLKWRELVKEDPHVFLISGSDPIDSYQLGSLSLNNFFYRSSLAAEFIKMGFPVTLLAETFWSTNEPGLVCKNTNEIMAVLENPKRNLEDENWINFGFYYGSTGEEFRFFSFKKNNGILREFFNGVAIDVPRWHRRGESRG